MHPAQVAILHALLFRPSATFAELQKASALTSDHFTFHLKQMAEQGLVEKVAAKRYVLTAAGKEYANRFDTDARTIERQPKVSALLAIKNHENKWLCQQRLKQPYYGFWGRPSGKIRYGETVLECAARELLEETGLTADLQFQGIYHKMDYNQQTGELLEDKIFFTVVGANPRGELQELFEGGRNAWLSLHEMRGLDKAFDGLASGIEKIESGRLTFEERRHEYLPEQY
jgi:8-oxo-dGTP pyrophosphatase MutT (NUDIX family)